MTQQQNNTSASNKRIAKNSIFMSIRMLVVMLISLYTTRVILSVLGVVDYGIYNVVCGFVSMFAFLNSSMSSATQRFYNFELGKNGQEGIKRVYNASIRIHLILAIIIVIVTEVFGIWYVENKLVIPCERIYAALWIFHFSVFSMFLNIINVPYTAVIMAYERMNYYALIGIIDSVLKLFIIAALYNVDCDRLIIYGFLYLCVNIFDFFAYRIYAKRNFYELRFGMTIPTNFFKEMLSFAGWNLFGAFAYMMREQGINLLLNSFFGPILNAAKGVTNQINGALQGFSSNIIIPARPQIVQSYAKGDYKRTFRLMNSISKLCCLVYLIMSLPICLLITPILEIWLGDNVPLHTSSFVVILLITNTWGSLIAPVSAVVHATGKMKFYQIISSASNLMSVPLALFFLLIKPIPEYAFYALFLTMITNHIAGLISLKRLTQFAILKYLKQVLLPLFFVIILSVLTTYIPHIFISNRIIDFICVLMLSSFSIIFYSFLLCLDREEKNMVKQMIEKFKNQACKRFL